MRHSQQYFWNYCKLPPLATIVEKSALKPLCFIFDKIRKQLLNLHEGFVKLYFSQSEVQSLHLECTENTLPNVYICQFKNKHKNSNTQSSTLKHCITYTNEKLICWFTLLSWLERRCKDVSGWISANIQHVVQLTADFIATNCIMTFTMNRVACTCTEIFLGIFKNSIISTNVCQIKIDRYLPGWFSQ